MSLLTREEVLDLINEVGQKIEMGTVETTAADPKTAAPARNTVNWCEVTGYIVPIKFQQIGVNGTQSAAGGEFNCYLLGSELETTSLCPNTMIRWQGKTLEAEYKEGMLSRGTVVLHHLILRTTQKSASPRVPPQSNGFKFGKVP